MAKKRRKEKTNSKAVTTKVKSKGKAKGVKNKLATSHEGKQICFAFNNGERKGSCDREHVCQICFGKHPMKGCSAKA